jgi:DNA polymerase/3'-5' exonuclease PolX
MKLIYAKSIAEELVRQLAPHCERIQIAGSIRREKPEVKDIEIVAIPKPYEVGLFESGIAAVVNRWVKVKGELPCKYTQRVITLSIFVDDPEGTEKGAIKLEERSIKLDLFFATPANWGLILAIRTGSAEYSHKVLASGWVHRGYHSVEGILFHEKSKWERKVKEEWELFQLLGIPMPEPKDREVTNG